MPSGSKSPTFGSSLGGDARPRTDAETGHRKSRGFFGWQARNGPEALMFVAVLLLALAVLVPVAVVAVAIYAALMKLRPPRDTVYIVALSCCAVYVVVMLATGRDPSWLVVGYLFLQHNAGATLWHTIETQTPFPWGTYLRLLGPSVLALAAPIGVLAYATSGFRNLWPWGSAELGGRAKLVDVDADTLRRDIKKHPARVLVGGLMVDGEWWDKDQPVAKEVKIEKMSFLAIGRVTAMPSLPKKGKSKAAGGLMRAFQEGWDWFGLFVVKHLKTFYVTEEDRDTFGGKLEEFDIHGNTLRSAHLPEMDGWLTPEDWPDFTKEMFDRARRFGAELIVFDTLTSIAPWVARGGEHMVYALRVLKARAVHYKMAVLVPLHDRKGGGEAVVRMLGAVQGAASYDEIVSFDRDKVTGLCTLDATGRLGEWKASARLDGVQYTPADAEDKGEDEEYDEKVKNETSETKEAVLLLPDRLAKVFAVIAGTPDGLGQKEIALATGKGQSQISRDLKELVDLGHLQRIDGKIDKWKKTTPEDGVPA